MDGVSLDEFISKKFAFRGILLDLGYCLVKVSF